MYVTRVITISISQTLIQPQIQSGKLCSKDFQDDIVFFSHVFINAPHCSDLYKSILQRYQKVLKAVTEQLAWCNTIKQQTLCTFCLFFCLFAKPVQEGCKKDCKDISPLIIRKIFSMKLFCHVQNSPVLLSCRGIQCHKQLMQSSD